MIQQDSSSKLIKVPMLYYDHIQFYHLRKKKRLSKGLILQLPNITRPDLAYVISKFSKFTASAGQEDLIQLKNVKYTGDNSHNH